jgi:hypothetical protein
LAIFYAVITKGYKRMKKNVLAIILSMTLGLALSASTLYAASVQWTTGAGANGHYYQWVSADSVENTWTYANTAAASLTDEGLTWTLATITSAEEQAFIAASLGLPAEKYWAWIGGVQAEGATTTDGDWEWITGETWSYTNWNRDSGGDGDDPNDGGDSTENGEESYLALILADLGYSNVFNNNWGDAPDFNANLYNLPTGYIAEAVVPLPAAFWLLGGGLIGLVALRRRKA